MPRTLPTTRQVPSSRHGLIIGANVLAIAWISAEIALVFGERAYASSAAGLPAGAARAELAQQVALSVAWALYAVGLVAAGFRRGYAPARYLAIALFGLTILKVLTKDIAELDRVYRMLSVLGLGRIARRGVVSLSADGGQSRPIRIGPPSARAPARF